ncbi:MAG: RDD family protein [Epsilonproteobacteria bacterium]|nr:RDD family protein [Campylobacterota bacterium]
MNPEEIEEKLHREQLQLASVNKRAFAYFLDELIVSAIFAIIVWDQLKSLGSPEAIMAYSQSLILYIMGVKVLYQSVFIYMYGATLGKLAVKIRVIESNYLGLPTVKEAILRAVVRVLSEMLFYLGFIVALFSPLKMTWQDRVASTLVVDV